MDEEKITINPRSYEEIVHVAHHIFNMVKRKKNPEIGIICGSGLGDIPSVFEDTETVPYSKIPGFPNTTVAGHKNNLIFGTLSGKEVVCLQGRFHPYEHNMNLALCALPVRIMHELGIKILIISNAAGGINENFERGDLMLIKDQLFLPGLAGFSPLVGLNGPEWGPKFVSLHDMYNKDLRKLALDIAKKMGIRMHEGTYAMCAGPQYESGAEIKFLKTCGVDAMGMSTCHEAVVAKQCGIKILGVSLITNINHGDANPSHEEVLESAKTANERMCKLIQDFVSIV